MSGGGGVLPASPQSTLAGIQERARKRPVNAFSFYPSSCSQLTAEKYRGP